MTPLPTLLQSGAAAQPVVAWRVDAAPFAPTWDSGIGSERVGGRWSPPGTKAVYCSIDPSTCIVEVAVHKGFKVLDTQPHVVTSLELLDLSDVRVVAPEEIPNPAWLHAGIPSAGQQAFGAALLRAHAFVVLPSAVSRLSWNLLFDPGTAAGKYRLRSQERLAIDTRLNPAA